MMFRQAQNTSITILPLLNIPMQVDIDHLHDNMKLLSDDEIKKVLEKINQIHSRCGDTPQTEFSKKCFPDISHYSIRYINEILYAVYLGVKHRKHLGEGNYGRVKLAQNLKTGEWIAYKIQPVGKDSTQTVPINRAEKIWREYFHTQELQA